MTDGVTNGTTTVTSATASFNANHLGNSINIAGDSDYQITTINSSTSISVDRSTANGGSGRSMKVGGAGTIGANGLDPVGFGTSVAVADCVIWVRRTNAAGVQTNYTSSIQVVGSAAATKDHPITVMGYGTVRGDNGVAVISSAAGGATTGNHIWRNLELIGNTGFNATLTVNGGQNLIENVTCLNNTNDSPALTVNSDNNRLGNVFCNANKSSPNDYTARLGGNGNYYKNCEFYNSRANGGILLLGSNTGTLLDGCLIWGNTGPGIKDNSVTANARLSKCIVWNNTGDNVAFASNNDTGIMAWSIEDCIIGKAGAYDLNYANQNLTNGRGAQQWANEALRCNFFFTTGTGRYNNLPASTGDTTLTVDPFVNSAAGNFNLNSTPGGGAVITNNPCVTSFADGLNSVSQFAGPYGATPASSSTVTMRSLWREATNERIYANGSGIPDATVDIYLDYGLQFLNRISRYHYTTDTTTLTLVAGQQEYAAPGDLIEAKWVRWGFKDLQKGDVERWRGDDTNWSSEPAGQPREWAQYGQQIILRPTPSAEAVAENAFCTLRYVSTPPSISTNGPEQLPSSAWRLAVLYGAALWNASYPDTVMAQQRLAALLQEAKEGAQLFEAEISGRFIGR